MVPPKIRKARFSAPPHKAVLSLASRDPLALGCPARRGQKRRKNMTHETKIHQTVAQGKPMISWAALLGEAVTKPGFIHEAYSRFHNYSLGNQLLALFQCFGRGIQPGPLATFPRWKDLGRHVKKGEKALILCMPLVCKGTKTVKADDGTEHDEQFGYTHFTYKAHWFVLSQTEGADYQPAALPEWNEVIALQALEVERIEFSMLDGNTQGYAKPGRKFA